MKFLLLIPALVITASAQEKVIDFTRPGPPGSPPQPQQLNLSTQQKTDLEAFLKTLTGNSIYTDEKFSSPFNTDNSLSVVILPTDSAEMTFSEVNGTQNITFRASGIPNVGYLFQKSPDLDEWTSTTINASSAGELEISVPIITSEPTKFYRFAYGVTAE